jgi:4,4'-diaponeurosporenoate glycosyltransferase
MQILIPLVVMVVGSSLFLWRLRVARSESSNAPAEIVRAVSIIVPARDEAHNLPTLLASLSALTPPPKEVIVVDDHSSDGTGDVARAFGARVVKPEPIPPGWIGKSWACWTGARVAKGEYLLFTDADTWHAPDSLVRTLGALIEQKVGLVSVIPTHRLVAFWEKLQGVYQLLLLIATRAGAKDRPGSGERRFAIGQYLLFKRSVYDAIGGHQVIADRLAEDLAVARVVSDAGYGVRVMFAPGAMQVRMYPEGLSAFIAGWRRSFRDGVGSVGVLAVLEIVMVNGWLLGIPLWMATAAVAGQGELVLAWLCAYCLTAWAIAREQRNYGEFTGSSALCYPLFVLLFVYISAASMFDALRGAPVIWRGRSIQLAR